MFTGCTVEGLGGWSSTRWQLDASRPAQGEVDRRTRGRTGTTVLHEFGFLFVFCDRCVQLRWKFELPVE